MGKKKVIRKAVPKQPTTEYPTDPLDAWLDLNRALDDLGYAQKMIEGTSQLLYFFFHCETVHDLKEVLHVNCGRVMALDACAIFIKKKLEEIRQAQKVLHEETKRQREAITQEAIRQFKARERARRPRRRA